MQSNKNENNAKIYFVTGGGTGGHIYPAISVAKALRDDNSANKIYYIGNPNNLEARIAKEENFEFLPVNISSMPRKINFNFIKWGFKLDGAVLKALYYINKYKPNAVFGTGGYVSAPAIISAFLSGTPYMIHDSDAHPGIVSRYASGGAKCISVAFEGAKKFLKNKNIKVLGNPIKVDFFETDKETAKKELNLDKKKTILIMGGSQGAMNINHTVVSCMKFFAEELKTNIILQTGAKNYDATIDLIEKTYPEYKKNNSIIIKPYFENMAIPMKASDLIVARAGSLSLSEIAASETPSILIPFPYAAADHQRKNAKCYEQLGASVYIDDFELNKDILEKTVASLIKDETRLKKMADSVKALSRPEATEQIMQNLKEIAK